MAEQPGNNSKEQLQIEVPTLNFDAPCEELLEKVYKDKTKAYILKSLNHGSGIIEGLGPKIAGIMAAPEAAKIGSEYVEKAVNEASKEKVVDVLSHVAININVPDLPTYQFQSEWLQWLNTLQSMINKLINDIEAWYKVVVEAKVNEKIQEYSSAAAQAIANASGTVAGYVAYLPAGAAGYLATSAMAGAVVSGGREYLRASSFKDIAPKVEAAERMIKDKVKNPDGTDPRLDLIALHERISEDPKLLGYKLTPKEWLALSEAVRAVRVDLLREKTAAPEIVASPEVVSALERQKRIIEAFVNSQKEIADEDIYLALEILSQFEYQVATEAIPFMAKQDKESEPIEKMIRYARRMGRGAMEGTGLPMLYRGCKFFFRAGLKTIKFTARPDKLIFRN